MPCVAPPRLTASSSATPLRISCQSDSSVSSFDFLPSKVDFAPRIALAKPTWVVRTESNVWKEQRKKPQPPCLVCRGSGRINCHHCQGRGRTNFVNQVMLPKGKWPQWCRTCGGSGLGYCNRCFGTGEYRELMGFHFKKKIDPTSTQSHRRAFLDQMGSIDGDIGCMIVSSYWEKIYDG